MDIKYFFENRRTIRRYTSQEVDDELLRDIIGMASHAPTAGNMQLYSVVVTRTKEGKERLAPMHFNQPSVTGSSVLLTFCADFNRFEKWCEASDAVPGYNNFQSFITAFLDAAIFAQQFCTIAEMYGLGCCYLGTTTYNAPQIAEELNLPNRVVPVTTLTVGYPDGDAVLSDRIPVKGIIHYEKYEDFNSGKIKSIYSEKEEREDSKRFVEENNVQSLAQVFTDVRYTKEANEYFSKVYRDFIESKGYKI